MKSTMWRKSKNNLRSYVPTLILTVLCQPLLLASYDYYGDPRTPAAQNTHTRSSRASIPATPQAALGDFFDGKFQKLIFQYSQQCDELDELILKKKTNLAPATLCHIIAWADKNGILHTTIPDRFWNSVGGENKFSHHTTLLEFAQYEWKFLAESYLTAKIEILVEIGSGQNTIKMQVNSTDDVEAYIEECVGEGSGSDVRLLFAQFLRDSGAINVLVNPTFFQRRKNICLDTFNDRFETNTTARFRQLAQEYFTPKALEDIIIECGSLLGMSQFYGKNSTVVHENDADGDVVAGPAYRSFTQPLEERTFDVQLRQELLELAQQQQDQEASRENEAAISVTTIENVLEEGSTSTEADASFDADEDTDESCSSSEAAAAGDTASELQASSRCADSNSEESYADDTNEEDLSNTKLPSTASDGRLQSLSPIKSTTPTREGSASPHLLPLQLSFCSPLQMRRLSADESMWGLLEMIRSAHDGAAASSSPSVDNTSPTASSPLLPSATLVESALRSPRRLDGTTGTLDAPENSSSSQNQSVPPSPSNHTSRIENSGNGSHTPTGTGNNNDQTNKSTHNNSGNKNKTKLLTVQNGLLGAGAVALLTGIAYKTGVLNKWLGLHKTNVTDAERIAVARKILMLEKQMNSTTSLAHHREIKAEIQSLLRPYDMRDRQAIFYLVTHTTQAPVATQTVVPAQAA